MFNAISFFMDDIIRITVKEFPPNAKKSSSIPIFYRLRIFSQTATIFSSVAVSGAAYRWPLICILFGSGSFLLSIFPLLVNGKALPGAFSWA
jgi:hypothetical protein